MNKQFATLISATSILGASTAQALPTPPTGVESGTTITNTELEGTINTKTTSTSESIRLEVGASASGAESIKFEPGFIPPGLTPGNPGNNPDNPGNSPDLEIVASQESVNASAFLQITQGATTSTKSGSFSMEQSSETTSAFSQFR